MVSTEDKSQQVYRLADTTYRNVEDFVKEMGGVVSSAKAVHKTLQAFLEASETFCTVIAAVGSKASNLPGGVRRIGECLTELSAAQRATNLDLTSWMGSLMTDFILPVEGKASNDVKRCANIHKLYRHDCLKKEHEIGKLNDSLKDYRKREKKGGAVKISSKERQNLALVAEEMAELDSLRTEGLRKALIEERKLYCFFLDHLCLTVHNQVAFYSQGHSQMSQKLVEWRSYCREPNSLPPESSILLVDPMSPRAFQRHSASFSEPPEHFFPRSPSAFSNGTAGEDTAQTNMAQYRGSRVSTLPNHLPPKQTPPGTEYPARAQFPFQATAPGQLSFKEGDMVEAIMDSKDGWQFGKNIQTGESGWFPCGFVVQLRPGADSEPPSLSSQSSVTQQLASSQPSPLTLSSQSSITQQLVSSQTSPLTLSSQSSVTQQLASSQPSPLTHSTSGQLQPHSPLSGSVPNVVNIMSPTEGTPPTNRASVYGTPSNPASAPPLSHAPPPPSDAPLPPPDSDGRNDEEERSRKGSVQQV